MNGIGVADILIPFAGGLGLFIYGMHIMAQGLQNAAGTRMKKLLEVLTNNKFMGVVLGAFITAIIQSSSATTVMVVGFVNAGIMNLSQAIGVIMGANIGTTVTGWIVSSVEWAKFLNPTMLSPIVVMAGVVLLIMSKNQKQKELAAIAIGFGILFIGITMMSDAVYPLRESEKFKQLFLQLGKNPLLGVLAGAAVTAIIQSSSASVGILQTLAASGLVPINAAVYIIMGQNIGTCVTAMLSSVGASKNAHSAAYMHLIFNVIGTVIFSIVAIVFFKVISPAVGEALITQTEISSVHTVFNISNTIILMPFSNVIIAISKKLSGKNKDDDKDMKMVHLDYRLLETPSIATQSAIKEVVRLGYIVDENLNTAVETIFDGNLEKINTVLTREKSIDLLVDDITDYLVKLCNSHINHEENVIVTGLLHIIGDIERVGDHSENLVEISKEMIENEVKFSLSAVEELKEMAENSVKSYQNAIRSLEYHSVEYAREVVRLEDVVDDIEVELRQRHIDRLSKNLCSVESGVVFLDSLTNFERISDHAMNIAQTVLEKKREGTLKAEIAQ